jgi:hypothetical protein
MEANFYIFCISIVGFSFPALFSLFFVSFLRLCCLCNLFSIKKLYFYPFLPNFHCSNLIIIFNSDRNLIIVPLIFSFPHFSWSFPLLSMTKLCFLLSNQFLHFPFSLNLQKKSINVS